MIEEENYYCENHLNQGKMHHREKNSFQRSELQKILDFFSQKLKRLEACAYLP